MYETDYIRETYSFKKKDHDPVKFATAALKRYKSLNALFKKENTFEGFVDFFAGYNHDCISHVDIDKLLHEVWENNQ